MIYKGTELHNVAETISNGQNKGIQISRIPNNVRAAVNENAKAKALWATGCEIRFNLESESAKVVLKAEGPAMAEVFQGSFLVSRQMIGSEPVEIKFPKRQNIDLLQTLTRQRKLPFDAGLTRLVLPYNSGITLMSIEGQTSPPRREQVPAKRYLAYGSSITHGSDAARPTGTYAMRTAQFLGADLINLGFGGGAHCEKELADYIAGRDDWDFASLEMGINMIRTFDPERFKSRVDYFIEKIGKSFPGKWVFCIDLFTFHSGVNGNAKKQGAFREIVRNRVKELGMPKLVHVDGRHLLKNVAGLKDDLVHPSPAGMEEIATNLSKAIAEKIESSG